MSIWKATPGSVLWLLRHEVRMFFYELGQNKAKNKRKRGMTKSNWVVLMLILLILHAGAWTVLREFSLAAGSPPRPLLLISSVVMLIVFTLMLSSAIKASVSSLFERGDLDLLLSAPLPSRHIFIVRLLGIVIGIQGLYMLFLLPLANAGLVLGQPRWLGIYPVLACMGLIAASLAMLLTLGLVKTLGVRRTRTVAQLISALVGASVFLLSQVFSNLKPLWRVRVADTMHDFLQARFLASDSLFWYPARALFGAPLPLLLLVAIACLCFFLTVKWTHRFFVTGVQQAAAVQVKKSTGNVLQLRFRQGLWLNMVFKEWRLILRDTTLLSDLLLQSLYMLPIIYVVFGKSDFSILNVAAALTLLSNTTVASLVWLTVSGEQAADLLLTAPVRPIQVKAAKFFAATLPVLLLLLPVYLKVLFSDVWGGVLLFVIGLSSIASICWINLCLARPGSRQNFRRRGQNNMLCTMLETLCSAAWLGSLLLAQRQNIWCVATLAGATIILGIAWLFRIRSTV